LIEGVLDRLLRAAHTISRYAAWIVGAILALSALAIAFDIAIRFLFNRTIGGGNELSGYALAWVSAWGITITLLMRAHVRIDAAYVHLSLRLRAILDIVALLSFVGFMSLVVYYGYYVLEQSIISRTRSVSTLEVQLAIPQFVWFIGLVFFLLVASLLLVRATVAFARGDNRLVQRLIGARSMSEDIAAERESLTGRLGPAEPKKGPGS
jgi:TRAP-type C4-dicarboxylate transport system permease small subunit